VGTFGETENRLVEIPQNLISEIILGSKMEDGVIAKIALYTEEIAPKYFLSTPDHSHRRFVIRPKAVAPCKHCYASGYRMDNL
jgi:hypothetical protein